MTPQGQRGAAEASALAAIVLSSHDAVIAKSLDGTITTWNDGATLVYGQSADQMLGQDIEITIPAESLVAERARHVRVAKGEPESGYRCLRMHSDGGVIEVVMSMSAVRDEFGEVVGVASISRPVSDKEHADAVFSSLLEAAPDAMVCVDPRGRIVLVNTQASLLFGYPIEELTGAPLEILIPSELEDRHRQHRDRFFAAPRPRAMGVGLELLARRRDGSTFPVEVSLAADMTGGEGLAIAAVRDVTDARAAQASLRESETRLRQLADHVDLVFTLRQLDPPAFLYVSPGFERLTGRDPAGQPPAGQGMIQMVHPDDRARVAVEYQTPMLAGQAARCEYRLVRPDGTIRWVRVFATPVPNPFGPPERTVTSAEDITERVEAAQVLQGAETFAREANDAKNDFLSRMSHELRTPLNAVLGFGQLLEHHLKGTEHAESVDQVLLAGRHLLELINEVLDIATIESGDISVSTESISVEAAVHDTALLMRPIADAANVRLVLSGGPAGCYVLADRQRLRQILLNLMSNAVKYNHPGGSVWLTWQVDPDKCTSISVRDDGPGIADEYHDRMFTPFDRLGAEGGSIEGTGVGLAVTLGLTELMNGSLSFGSKLGEGTCFTVALPSAEEPAVNAVVRRSPPMPTPSPPADAAAPGLTTVLYIDDNEPNVRVMQSVLQLRPDWRLIHAGLAGRGIELARAELPDLILLDLHLPDGSGLEVLKALKGNEATADIQVVILSADAGQEQIRRMLAAGAAQYLTKPLDLTEVLAVLDAVRSARPPSSGDQ
jgi:PAS domain S-box-containing protein